MAWSVLVLTLGGSSLLYLLIQRGAATAVTSLLYLVPPCTAVMAWLLFGEPITLPMLAACADRVRRVPRHLEAARLKAPRRVACRPQHRPAAVRIEPNERTGAVRPAPPMPSDAGENAVLQ